MLLQGQLGVSVHCISAYQSVNTNNGPDSVAVQHQCYFMMHHAQEIDLRKQLLHNLRKDIEAWIQAGDQIILGINTNKDICAGNMAQFLKKHGLSKAILAKNNQSPLTTQNCNTQRIPIN